MIRLIIGEATRPQSPVMRLLMVAVLAATVSVILGDVEAPAAGVNPGTRVVNLDDVKTPAAAVNVEDRPVKREEVKSRASAMEAHTRPIIFQSSSTHPEHDPVTLDAVKSQAPAIEPDSRSVNPDDVKTPEPVKKPRTSPADYQSLFIKPDHNPVAIDGILSQTPAMETKVRHINREDVKARALVTKPETTLDDVQPRAPVKRLRTRPIDVQSSSKRRTSAANLAKTKSQTPPNKSETSPSNLDETNAQASVNHKNVESHNSQIEPSGIDSDKLSDVSYETPAIKAVKIAADSLTGLEETMRPVYQDEVREKISPSRVKRAAPRTKTVYTGRLTAPRFVSQRTSQDSVPQVYRYY